LRWHDLVGREERLLLRQEVRAVIDVSDLNSRVRLALSADGRLLACLEGRTLRTWRLPEAKLAGRQERVTVEGDPAWFVSNGALSIVGASGQETVLLGMEDGRVLRLSPGLEELGLLTDPADPVSPEAFQQAPSPLAPRPLAGLPPLLASLDAKAERGGWESTLRIWPAEGPHCLLRAKLPVQGFRLAASPRGRRLLIGSMDGRVLLAVVGPERAQGGR
jgi:hypothetical protein